jgi:SAM-dependent methyltransferase
MKQNSTIYVLATGERDVERLRILNAVYGPASQAALRQAGLREGARVVEVGCGVGNMTCWIAGQVGPGGSVVGIDKNPAQLNQARKQAAQLQLSNVTFQEGDAYSPGLPAESFDLAYCRLMLIHLRRPVEAVRAMRQLVRPGGQVLCEELDLGHWLCEPPARGIARFFEMNLKLGERRSEDFRLGGRLSQLFREAGFSTPQATGEVPLVLRGENKRLLWMTYEQIAPALVQEGLATQDEVNQDSMDMLRVAEDDTTLLGMPLMVQVWAVK